MRSLLLFLILASTTFFTIAQTIEGTYINKWESSSGEAIAYKLILNTDGTFTFRSTQSYIKSNPEKTVVANGIWTLENRLLVLKTKENSNQLASNLNMNKARYVSISPRNPKFNLVKPSLKFYKSDVFYAKEMELIKVETPMTANAK